MQPTTQARLRAEVGAAMNLPGENACKMQPPPWYKAQLAGVRCRPGEALQCGAPFAANVTVAGATQGTLTWVMNTSHFQQFRSVGLHFFAIEPGGAAAAAFVDQVRGFTIEDMNYAGTNYLGSAIGLNLVSFGVNQLQALSVVDLPEFEPGKQNLNMVVNNITAATTLRLFAFLYGYARR